MDPKYLKGLKRHNTKEFPKTKVMLNISELGFGTLLLRKII